MSLENKRAVWGTRFGFYLAAIGTAFGLGNLWRFPYVVAENGGGAFVLLYVFLIFLIGAPLLIGELILGKSTRQSVVTAIAKLKENTEDRKPLGHLFHKMLPYIGKLPVLVSTMVLAYFAVISSWVLYYLTQFAAGYFKSGGFQADLALQGLLDNGWLQVLLTSVHLIIVMIIVARDVEEGIEKWVGYMMPVFCLLLIIMAYQSLSLPSAPEALRFLLYPDFSRLSASSLSEAIGHLLFTLSIGFGMMVTFGSYMKKKTYIPAAGIRVATLDTMISIFAGLLIFPLVIAAMIPASGPELLFQTVPVLLSQMPGGIWFGLGFFVCLYLSALGASIGLFETVVANLKDAFEFERSKASWMAGLACFGLALGPALSSSVFSDFKLGRRGLIELLDGALINWILPVSALFICLAVGHLIDSKVKRQEILQEGDLHSMQMYRHHFFIIKYLAPSLIVLALVLQLFGLMF